MWIALHTGHTIAIEQSQEWIDFLLNITRLAELEVFHRVYVCVEKQHRTWK